MGETVELETGVSKVETKTGVVDEIGRVDVGMELRADTVRTLRQSARALFNKYVHEDAALQINVSYAVRSRLYALDFENYASLTPVTWIALFDDTVVILEEYIRQLYIELIGELWSSEDAQQKKRVRLKCCKII